MVKSINSRFWVTLRKRKSSLVFLVPIILLAGVLRFWNLTSLPFPPNGDEVAYGYYGWSLLHYGTDEYGHKYPLSFTSIGDYKYPGLAYLNIIPAALFGLSPLEIRFVGALSGVLLVPLVYLLGYALSSQRSLALFAAFFTAISPWSILESRLGYESHPALTIFIAGLVLLLYARASRLRFSLGLFLLLFSTFTFAAQRLVVPLILLGLLVIYKKPRYLIAFLLAGTVVAFSLISPTHRGRAEEVVWSGITDQDRNHLLEIYVAAGVSPVQLPPRITWMFHNKYLISVTAFADRYLDHFSPKFLFFVGEATEERIQDMGVLLLSDIALIPIGLLFLKSKTKKEGFLLILALLTLAPLPSALTSGGAHITRGTMLLVPFALLSAAGFSALPRLLKPIMFLVVLFCLGIALHKLLVINPTYRPWYPKQVYAQTATLISELRTSYQAVVIGGNDYIYHLFYEKINPLDFISHSTLAPTQGTKNWERVDRLYNIYFKMPFHCPKSGKAGVLYVCSGMEIPQNSRIIATVDYLDLIPAYTLLTYYPISQMPANLPPPPGRRTYFVDVESNGAFPDGIIPDSHPTYW